MKTHRNVKRTWRRIKKTCALLLRSASPLRSPIETPTLRRP